MLKRSDFVDELVNRIVRANRIPAAHPPLIPPRSKLGLRESGQALNVFEQAESASFGFWAMPLPKAVIFLLFAMFAWPTQAGVREVGAIGLTVGDLDREVMFYTNTLPFELVSISQVSG